MLPPYNKPYAQKDMIDHAIDRFVLLEKPTMGDLNTVITSASLQFKIDTYRAQAENMDYDSFMNEKHQSKRLGEFLGVRPHPKCHAHAIIAGNHPRAAATRAIIAWFEMRIDDPHNGCWLPENTAAKPHMPQWLRQAVPHSRIHRNGYYFWLDQTISLSHIKNIDELKRSLRQVKTKLQNSTFPSYVMLKAEQLKKQGMV